MNVNVNVNVPTPMTTLLGLAVLLPMALPASYPAVPMKGIGGKDLGMPLVGLGTWQYNSSVAEAAVKLAFSLGYRHVDTALGYGNQDGVGRGLAAASAAAGLKRADYFVTSKIPGGLNTSAAIAALDQALEQLFPGDKDAYVDLMLQHFPASWSGEGGPSLRKEQWLAMEAWAVGTQGQGESSEGLRIYGFNPLPERPRDAPTRSRVTPNQVHRGRRAHVDLRSIVQ